MCVMCVVLCVLVCHLCCVVYFFFCFMFFFFQAEDGIRDLTVTGVQTCALPISGCGRFGGCERNVAPLDFAVGSPQQVQFRSEERRVGKECRSRWSPYH